MQEFTYAHKNTQGGERETPTAQFNKPDISEKLSELRQSAFAREIPVSDDETLNFLITLIRAVKPQNILELGTAVGLSGAAMLQACPEAHLTTIEKNPEFFAEAQANFNALGLTERLTAICGDAGEEIEKLTHAYDLIFLDCAKVQYVKYLPRLKQLLKSGGILLADDILLFGYITGEQPVPPKRKMLVRHVKEYIDAVTCDSGLTTTIINIGNGIALSVNK